MVIQWSKRWNLYKRLCPKRRAKNPRVQDDSSCLVGWLGRDQEVTKTSSLWATFTCDIFFKKKKRKTQEHFCYQLMTALCSVEYEFEFDSATSCWSWRWVACLNLIAQPSTNMMPLRKKGSLRRWIIWTGHESFTNTLESHIRRIYYYYCQPRYRRNASDIFKMMKASSKMFVNTQ